MLSSSRSKTVYGDRLGDLYAAIRRLIRTPSPDLAALAAKIVFTVDHEIAGFDWGERCMRALKRDALRLAAVRGTQELGGGPGALGDWTGSPNAPDFPLFSAFSESSGDPPD